MHRLSVIFHEYLHVVQITQCGDSSNDSPTWSLWLWEGAAMATENLYLDYYFRAQGDAADTTGSALYRKRFSVSSSFGTPSFGSESWKWDVGMRLE